jgi:hypothetical protein
MRTLHGFARLTGLCIGGQDERKKMATRELRENRNSATFRALEQVLGKARRPVHYLVKPCEFEVLGAILDGAKG